MAIPILRLKTEKGKQKMVDSKVVAYVIADDGQIYDECYGWEAGQNYAMHEGLRVVAVADDGFMTKTQAQSLYDFELAAYMDCWEGK